MPNMVKVVLHSQIHAHTVWTLSMISSEGEQVISLHKQYWKNTEMRTSSWTKGFVSNQADFVACFHKSFSFTVNFFSTHEWINFFLCWSTVDTVNELSLASRTPRIVSTNLWIQREFFRYSALTQAIVHWSPPKNLEFLREKILPPFLKQLIK